jgi:hypothetical protein
VTRPASPCPRSISPHHQLLLRVQASASRRIDSRCDVDVNSEQALNARCERRTAIHRHRHRPHDTQSTTALTGAPVAHHAKLPARGTIAQARQDALSNKTESRPKLRTLETAELPSSRADAALLTAPRYANTPSTVIRSSVQIADSHKVALSTASHLASIHFQPSLNTLDRYNNTNITNTTTVHRLDLDEPSLKSVHSIYLFSDTVKTHHAHYMHCDAVRKNITTTSAIVCVPLLSTHLTPYVYNIITR